MKESDWKSLERCVEEGDIEAYEETLMEIARRLLREGEGLQVVQELEVVWQDLESFRYAGIERPPDWRVRAIANSLDMKTNDSDLWNSWAKNEPN